MIRGIRLPADAAKPAELVELNQLDTKAYREIVGGPLKVVELHKPVATLYTNKEGKVDGLPLNAKATHLSWVHSPEMRGHDIIVGDALLVGPQDKRIYEQSVPRYFREAVFSEGKRTVEYRRGNSRWVLSELVFNEWAQAYQWGAEFMHQTTDITELRVVPLEVT